MISAATQANLKPSNESVGTQTIDVKKDEHSIGVQAFEENPWEGLLSKQEVCELIEIENIVGLGMKDQPQAKYENHTITCKRVMSNGVVYQVVILKEQYLQEKEITKVVEVPCKQKKTNKEKDLEIVEIVEIEEDTGKNRES